MAKHPFFSVYMVFVVLTLTSCTGAKVQRITIGSDVITKIPPISLEQLQAYPGSGQVKLINAVTNDSPQIVRKDTDLFSYGLTGNREWWVNYRELTGNIIQYVTNELTKRNIHVTNVSDREVSISVVDCQSFLTLSKDGPTMRVYLRVKIPNIALTRYYRGISKHGEIEYALCLAINQAVLALLKDPDVTKYVQSGY